MEGSGEEDLGQEQEQGAVVVVVVGSTFRFSTGGACSTLERRSRGRLGVRSTVRAADRGLCSEG